MYKRTLSVTFIYPSDHEYLESETVLNVLAIETDGYSIGLLCEGIPFETRNRWIWWFGVTKVVVE